PKYDRVKFIPLETTSACLINTIQQIAIKDSFIYVSDMNEAIYAFNKHGKFIRRIGTMGHGPTEYIRLHTFYIDHINNNIVIIDGVKKNS
ncbi:MAG: 6-bladed beta-propeller, partial [Odoribacter sp.]|nr:6-bladed beta-propeller [Odoribacter sp.]